MPVADNDTQYEPNLLFSSLTVCSPAVVCPSLNIWALGVVWHINSPTAALSFCYMFLKEKYRMCIFIACL